MLCLEKEKKIHCARRQISVPATRGGKHALRCPRLPHFRSVRATFSFVFSFGFVLVPCFCNEEGGQVAAFRSNAQGATYYSGVTKSPHLPFDPPPPPLSLSLWEDEKLLFPPSICDIRSSSSLEFFFFSYLPRSLKIVRWEGI